MDEYTVDHWSDFEKASENFFKSHKQVDWFYRGQTDYNWTLTPSILRILPDDVTKQKAHGYENQVIRNFISEYSLYQENEINLNFSNTTTNLMIMQHYGCPTRLLDWTYSIYIALYFAVKDKTETDSSIYVFPAHFLNNSMDEKYGKIAIKDIEAYFDHDDISMIYPITPIEKARRIAAQQGWFTIGNNILLDHQDLIDNNVKNSQNFIKIKIKNSFRIEALDRLHFMNISGKTIFPGLDGLGKWTTELLTIRNNMAR